MTYNRRRVSKPAFSRVLLKLSGEALIRVDIDGDKASKADHWPMNARIRAIDQGPDGAVYLLQDGNSGGKLLRLDPAK